MILFTILIASFLISNYFINQNLEDNLRYKDKDYYKTGYIFSLFGWLLLVLGYFIGFIYVYYSGLILLLLCIIKEIIFTCKRINYYNKVLKSLEVDNKKLIKRKMEIDSIKRIFYLLSSPLLLIQNAFNYLLEKIF